MFVSKFAEYLQCSCKKLLAKNLLAANDLKICAKIVEFVDLFTHDGVRLTINL